MIVAMTASIRYACHVCRLHVYAMLEDTARRLPTFDKRRQRLPFYHVTLLGHAAGTDSGARNGITTACTKEATEALTVLDSARHTYVEVSQDIDPRGRRSASTQCMQPRGAETVAR